MLQTRPDTKEVFRSWLERARAERKTGEANEIKRNKARTPWVVPVDLAIDVPGGEHRVRSHTRDISGKGLGILCREAVPIGKRVTVYLRDGSTCNECVEGKVHHCTMTVGGFKIGVRVIP